MVHKSKGTEGEGEGEHSEGKHSYLRSLCHAFASVRGRDCAGKVHKAWGGDGVSLAIIKEERQ